MSCVGNAAKQRYHVIVGMLAAASLLITGAAVAQSPAGGVQMDYRVIEQYYGPEIRFNDWEAEGGKLASAGGTLQIFAEETAKVTRTDYQFGGGGDVELALAFNFERMAKGGTFIAHFNWARAETSGFRVIVDAQHVTVFHKDEEVYQADGPPLDRGRQHTLKLVTLAESYAVSLNDQCLAQGRMDPPYTENEGRMRFIVRDAAVRIISFAENFIVHDVTFAEWRRTQLLYEEPFGAASLAQNWECNGEQPEIEDDACTFQPMSVNILKERFAGPIAVDCLASPTPTEEFSAGVTDAIFLWMIDKPDGDLFEYMRGLPDATLGGYVPLQLYWMDFGGTNNRTTRLRKHPGRHMIRQFTDRARLLERDRSYQITLVQNGNVVEFWVDGKRWIQVYDPNPYTDGYIGFRAFVAGLTIKDLKIWRIE